MLTTDPHDRPDAEEFYIEKLARRLHAELEALDAGDNLRWEDLRDADRTMYGMVIDALAVFESEALERLLNLKKVPRK